MSLKLVLTSAPSSQCNRHSAQFIKILTSIVFLLFLQITNPAFSFTKNQLSINTGQLHIPGLGIFNHPEDGSFEAVLQLHTPTEAPYQFQILGIEEPIADLTNLSAVYDPFFKTLRLPETDISVITLFDDDVTNAEINMLLESSVSPQLRVYTLIFGDEEGFPRIFIPLPTTILTDNEDVREFSTGNIPLDLSIVFTDSPLLNLGSSLFDTRLLLRVDDEIRLDAMLNTLTNSGEFEANSGQLEAKINQTVTVEEGEHTIVATLHNKNFISYHGDTLAFTVTLPKGLIDLSNIRLMSANITNVKGTFAGVLTTLNTGRTDTLGPASLSDHDFIFATDNNLTTQGAGNGTMDFDNVVIQHIETQTFRDGEEHISWSASNIPLDPDTAELPTLVYEVSGEETCSFLDTLSFKSETSEPECNRTSKLQVEIFR